MKLASYNVENFFLRATALNQTSFNTGKDALAAHSPLEAGGITIRAVKPSWAKFDWPGETKVAP